MNLVLSHKSFYWIWFLGHVVLLVLSGYLGRISNAFLKMDWVQMIKLNDKFYPFKDSVIQDYDITEFLVYIIAPIILFKIFKVLLGR